MIMKQRLISLEEAAEMIRAGAFLAFAGDEKILANLPNGNWIGGTIPYFMGQDGGVTTRDQLFVTPIPTFAGFASRIQAYDTETLKQVATDGGEHGFSLIILPAYSAVHAEFATNAAMYEDMYMNPLVGWVSGIHLDDAATHKPKVRDGRTGQFFDNKALVIHVPLPEHISANVSIINLFIQGDGDVIEFLGSGFEVSQCLVNGKQMSLAKYLKQLNHDVRLPLVADYCGAMINAGFKDVDAENDRVSFYGSVFPNVIYKLAKPFAGTYEAAFNQALEASPGHADFSCNCVLNYLYSELEGKRTGEVMGPMTFGEVGYVLLNQTMVRMALKSNS